MVEEERRVPAPTPAHRQRLLTAMVFGWGQLRGQTSSVTDLMTRQVARFDLDLLEATPGIEPGIAVLQFGHVCSQASADVRSEVKYEQPEPLSAADVRQRSPALPSVMPSASSASAKTVLRTQAISGEQRP